MELLKKGHVSVVTGAAQGIGFAIGQVLAQHGAVVVLLDVDEAAVTAAAERLAADSGATVLGLKCDVTNEADVAAVGATVARRFGGLDSWINNAGITRDASLRNLSLADFERVIQVHLSGTWLGIRVAADIMREQGSGSIINMSSLSGKSGNPGQTNYSAAKAGIVGLTKAAAKELAHKGVRVNAVQPGLIRTPMTEAMKPEVFAAREADVPMKRAGQPEEVANVVLFLASDLSSYMTGSVLEVGGGRYM